MSNAMNPLVSTTSNNPVLDFLWLEITNQCNLQCQHCYSESSPYSTDRNLLTEQDYLRIIKDARILGCRQIQFIGGEPTLNKSLTRFITYAREIGYEFVEVFTNLISLHPSLVEFFSRHQVAVATSIYSDTPGLHDQITKLPGSHQRTLSNVRALIDRNVELRAAIVIMDENKNAVKTTVDFLRGLGIIRVSVDHLRTFGGARSGMACALDSLCGNCANNILAVGPDGLVAPCIMSKEWAVGSVFNTSLHELAHSESLQSVRRRIGEATGRFPVSECAPYSQCAPANPTCGPNCSPNYSCGPCSPNASRPCDPNLWCNPATRVGNALTFAESA